MKPYKRLLIVVTFITGAAIVGAYEAQQVDKLCTNAIASISDQRKLGLFITDNPLCAFSLKRENWPMLSCGPGGVLRSCKN